MSLRYVWGRYNIITTLTEQISEVPIGDALDVQLPDDTYWDGWYFYGSYTINQELGCFEMSNYNGHNSWPDSVYCTADTKYCCVASYALNPSVSGRYTVMFEHNNVNYTQWGSAHLDRERSLGVFDRGGGNRTAVKFKKHEIVNSQSQGSKIDDIATPTSGQYPSNGVSGSYWYVYQGQDSIDPVSIEAPITNWLYIGQQVVVTASPSVSKVYGGMVSYQYQVQINGESWTNIGSKTTATSVNYTIPEGTVSIAFRVQASDDLGFTSTDWVQSETYIVSKYEPGIKHRVHRKNEDGEYDITHFETDTSCVLMSDGTSLEDQLVNIISEIERRGG